MTNPDETQNTRDNIGARDQTRNLILIRNNERLLAEENSTIVSTNTVGHSFIVTHTVNGKLGAPQLGMDGQQIILGEAGRTRKEIYVLNPNRKFRENFRDTTFQDTGVTTADWDTTNYKVQFTNGEVVQTKAIARILDSITKAEINIAGTALTNLSFELSANGTADFEGVTTAVEHEFTTTGSALYFKATASGTAEITKIIVAYSTN